ncbi:hypothetical protein OIU76_011953 [Salix suchowensis]|nr:hypothetical protein OIU76_011953 [Salix suchowensis]
MTIGQFIHILSSRLELTPGKALFVFVKNTLPQTASQMDSVYESYKDDDGISVHVLQQRENIWLSCSDRPFP